MEKPSPLQICYRASASFVRLLDQAGCSLALSAYMQDRIILLSAGDGAIQLHAGAFRRPMGLATRIVGGSHRLAAATFHDLVVLADAPLLGSAVPNEREQYQHVLVPRLSLHSGDIDAHDLVWIGAELFAANTRFSCISRIDAEASFTPVWKPPFISALMPEDRCHLNGIAADTTRIAYVTAFGTSDVGRGWGAGRAGSGVLMDVASGRLVLEGLSMPHSPRLFDDDLYVLESGKGQVLRVDAAAGTAQAIIKLPGFVRGFDRHGDVLFVGLSRLRDGTTVSLPIQQGGTELQCGVAAIDRAGTLLGWLYFDEPLTEIFDIKVLPEFRQGAILGSEDERHRQALVLPGRAFWGEPLADVAARHAQPR